MTGHGAELTVDLDALVANWRLLASRAGSAACGAVIKADAYGCGIEQVAPALRRAGCMSFFVAHLSEARRVRAAVADATIYVLNGLLPGAAALFLADELRPVLGSAAELTEWSLHGKGAPCAVHVDTGMNRLGFAFADLAVIADEAALRSLGARVVMTHLSASEDRADPATTRQAERFAKVAARYPNLAKSLFNSSAHFWPGLQPYDLTRPGYALYGGNPTPGQPNPMRPVVTLTATILQVREVADGEAAGYNGRWRAKGRRKLATICLGYADGYPRNGGAWEGHEGGHALVGGVLCPFAGTVSMDLIILDVTDAPSEAAKRGAPVTLIGEGLDLERVGAGARTIGYEILTSLRHRAARVYGGG
jgi:alanine racemase